MTLAVSFVKEARDRVRILPRCDTKDYEDPASSPSAAGPPPERSFSGLPKSSRLLAPPTSTSIQSFPKPVTEPSTPATLNDFPAVSVV